MSKQQVYGVIVLGLFGLNLLMAAIVMFHASWMAGGGYIIACAAGSAGIIYAYCAKCPCKTEHCGHVIPGLIARKIDRKSMPYTPLEYGVVALALLLILGLPQFWLWQHSTLLVIFWGLIGVSIIPMRTVICPNCSNTCCPLSK